MLRPKAYNKLNHRAVIEFKASEGKKCVCE